MAFMDDLETAVNDAQDFLNNNNPLTEEERSQFRSDGFMIPSSFSADGNGLPYTKVPSWKNSQIKRNIITWFVPEFGTVRMYINPQGISYQHKKLINKDRTKGGYTIQYWGEELTTLNITGVTGSAGIEGINMLYEIYRAEQYAFDSIGLSLASTNAATDLANQGLTKLGDEIGGDWGAGIGGALGGLLGSDTQNANALAAKNITTIAQLACGVEMYYNGAVYRGFFENMTVNEKANDFLIDYAIIFTVTQKRGYRTNYFPFAKTPAKGPSQYNTPYSFNGSAVTNGVQDLRPQK